MWFCHTDCSPYTYREQWPVSSYLKANQPPSKSLSGQLLGGFFIFALGRKKRKSRFTFHKTISDEPMPDEEWEFAEKILAKLVAEAYAADHPEIFSPVEGEEGARVPVQDETDKKRGGPNEDLS